MFSQSRVVKENNSLKEPRALIATSRGFPAELGNIPELCRKAPRSCDYTVHILIYEKFTVLISTSSFLIQKHISIDKKPILLKSLIFHWDTRFSVDTKTNMAAGRIEYACMECYCRYCSTFERSRGIYGSSFIKSINLEMIMFLIAEFESAEKYMHHCRTRVYFQRISLRGNCM